MTFSPGQYVTEDLIREGILAIGDGYRAKNSELSDVGLPFARAGNINNGFLFDGADCFPEADIEKVGEKRSRIFDSVFTSKGTVGRIAFVKEGTQEFVYSPQLCFWRSLAPDILDPRFLNYWMNGKEFINQIDYLKGQTDMADYVSLRDQRNMTITIPPIQEQLKSAMVLAALDDHIELNQQINQTLQQIAQAIFKSWFVDFEPVKAKQHVRILGGNDEQIERAAQAVIAGAVNLDVITTTTHINALDQQLAEAASEQTGHQTDAQREQLATTASRFTGKLVESELGLIPDGWEVTTLSNMVTLIGGGTPKRSEERYWGGDIPWFSVKDAPEDGQVFVLDTDLKITEEGLNESSTRLLDEGATIISARGTVGRLALVGVPMAMNQSCYGVVGVEGVPPIYNHFNLRRAVNALKQNTHGAVFDTITRATFDTIVQVAPSSTILECFDDALGPLIGQIKANLQIVRELEYLRDALLPKLLSGELGQGKVDRDG